MSEAEDEEYRSLPSSPSRIDDVEEEKKEEVKEEKKEDVKEDKSSLPASTISPKNNPSQDDYRFRFPVNFHTLILGSTQSGKTHFIKKLFIDGFDVAQGKKPFEMVIYVGNEEPSEEFKVAAQVSNYTYANIKPSDNKQIPVFYIPKSEALSKLGATVNNEDYKKLHKLVIIDDLIKTNDAKVNKEIASLVAEGQHSLAYYILVMHNSSGEKVVELRNACRTRVFIGNVTPTQLRIVCGDSSVGPNAYSKYAEYINTIPAFDNNGKQNYKKILIYDTLTKTFYNYNLYKINI
jgi:hypothetical protein